MILKIQNIKDKVSEIETKIKAAGGTMTDDEINVSGVKIIYRILSDDQVGYEIDSKPWIVSEEYIHRKIKEYFN